MREEMNTIEISIPQELDQRVRQAMGQVRAIHRRRILRRAGAAMGSFAAVVGVLLGMAAVNPAMASQIPLVGDWLGSLFYQVNYDSKVGTTGAFVETYEAMEDVLPDMKVIIEGGNGSQVQQLLPLEPFSGTGDSGETTGAAEETENGQ